MITHIKQKMVNFFKKHRFFQSILVLTSGNVMAQLIILLSTPILTRIYSPNDFGLLGIYVSILAILASVSSLQYENTITLPKEQKDAAQLVIISFIALLLVCIVTSVLLVMFKDPVAQLFQANDIKNFFFLLPLSLAAIGGNKILNGWSNRKGQYRLMSEVKVTQSIFMVISQIMGGLWLKGAVALLIGDVIGRSGGNTRFIQRVLKEDLPIFKKTTLTALKQHAARYKKFPMYSSFASLMRQVSVELPVLLLTVYYGPSIVGLYVLAQRLLSLPLFVIGTSVSNVYLLEASKAVHSNPYELKRNFYKTVKMLTLIILPIFMIIIFAGPPLFSILFGPEWKTGGTYLPLLASMYVLQFIVIPVGSTVLVLERHDFKFLREAIRIALLWGAMFYSHVQNYPPTTAILLLSIAGSLGFIVYGFLSWLAIIQFERRLQKAPVLPKSSTV